MKDKLEALRKERLDAAKKQYDDFCNMIDSTMLTFSTGNKDIDEKMSKTQKALADEKKKSALKLYEQTVLDTNTKIDMAIAAMSK